MHLGKAPLSGAGGQVGRRRNGGTQNSQRGRVREPSPGLGAERAQSGEDAKSSSEEGLAQGAEDAGTSYDTTCWPQAMADTEL